MKLKIVLFIIICLIVDCVTLYFSQTLDAQTKSDLALAAVNGGAAEHSTSRTYSIAANQLYFLLGLSNVIAGLLLFLPSVKSKLNSEKENS